MRKEIIQAMYDHLVNEIGLPDEIDDIFDSITEKVEELSNIEEAELIGNKLAHMGYAAFFLGANMILDFISGKETGC